MKSPFPGMDPYLEQHWRDVHARLILYAGDQLEDQLPGNLIARVEERIVFETEEPAQHWVYPDVKILERPGRKTAGTATQSAAAVMEPFIVRSHGEPATETFINILDPEAGFRLVTVLEVLSLANKLPGKGQRKYRRKQDELRQGRVSLVEIDLLRRGHRVFMLSVERMPPEARALYQACVWRASKPEQWEVYAMPLQSPLRAIRIPLRKKDDDIRLDLQAIVDQAYRKGRYYATINYNERPDPPLEGADARWAKALMRKAKKR